MLADLIYDSSRTDDPHRYSRISQARANKKRRDKETEDLYNSLGKMMEQALRDGAKVQRDKRKQEVYLARKRKTILLIITVATITIGKIGFKIHHDMTFRYDRTYTTGLQNYQDCCKKNDISVVEYTMLFDSNTQDVHTYIYAFYTKTKNWLGISDAFYDKMNTLIFNLSLHGHVKAENFSTYCQSLGATKEKEGHQTIDFEKYESKMNAYSNALAKQAETGEEVVVQISDKSIK